MQRTKNIEEAELPHMKERDAAARRRARTGGRRVNVCGCRNIRTV
jgi:hypothetical protein